MFELLDERRGLRGVQRLGDDADLLALLDVGLRLPKIEPLMPFLGSAAARGRRLSRATARAPSGNV